jgi:hypothetical protein
MALPANIILACLFVTSIIGPYFWYQSYRLKNESEPLLGVKSCDPLWRCDPIPLSPRAKSILRPTEYVNSRYTLANGQTFSAFYANWNADSQTDITVIQHTPDVCWTLEGWRPIGKADRIVCSLSNVSIPFKCRIFENQASKRKEIVFWCALANSSPIEESGMFEILQPSAGENLDWSNSASTYVRAENFMTIVSKKISGGGKKQFLRVSTELLNSEQSAKENIKTFISSWVGIRH